MKGDMNTRHFKAFWQMESTNQRHKPKGRFFWFVVVSVYRIVIHKPKQPTNQRDGSFGLWKDGGALYI